MVRLEQYDTSHMLTMICPKFLTHFWAATLGLEQVDAT